MNLIDEDADGTRDARSACGRRTSRSAASRAAAGTRRASLVVEPMGSETLVTLDRAGQRLVARAAARLPVEPDTAFGSACPRTAS